MNKKTLDQKKEPVKLTPIEKSELKKNIFMRDWHFDKLIKPCCTKISYWCIAWEEHEMEDGKKANEPVKVYIYGLEAMNAETKEHVIDGYFIRYAHRVYQEYSIENALKLKDLIQKEYLRDKYEEEIEDLKWEEKQKKLKAA